MDPSIKAESSQPRTMLEKKRKLEQNDGNIIEETHIVKAPKTVGMIKPNEMDDAIQSHQKGHILIKLKEARTEISHQLEKINAQDNQIKVLRSGLVSLRSTWTMLINDLNIIASQSGLNVQDLSERLFQSDNSNEFYNILLNEFKTYDSDKTDSSIPEELLKEVEFTKKLLLAILHKNNTAFVSTNLSDKLHEAENKLTLLSDNLLSAELKLTSTEEELQHATERYRVAEKTLFKFQVFKKHNENLENNISNSSSTDVPTPESTSSSNMDVLHEEAKLALRSAQNDLNRVSEERLKLQVLLKKLQTELITESQVTTSSWFNSLLKEKNYIKDQLVILENKLTESNKSLIETEANYNERISILQKSFDLSIDNLKSQIEKLLNKHEVLFKENENHIIELENLKTRSTDSTISLFKTEYSSIIQSQNNEISRLNSIINNNSSTRASTGNSEIDDMKLIQDEYELQLVNASDDITALQQQNARLLNQMKEFESLNLKMTFEASKNNISRDLAKQHEENLCDFKNALENTATAKQNSINELRNRISFLENKITEITSNQSILELKLKESNDNLATTYSLTSQIETYNAQIKIFLSTQEESVRTITKYEDELKTLRSDLARRTKMDRKTSLAGSSSGLEQELKVYKSYLICSVCSDRFKEVVITKCFHCFCRPCIKANLETRHRKCPGCGKPFGDSDVKPIYLN